MPNCFSLTRKTAPEAGAVKLALIDEELCKLLNVPIHPKLWVRCWFDIVGFALACGRSFSELLVRYQEEYMTSCDPFDWDLYRITDYLNQNYTNDAWVEVGRR